MRSKRKRIWRRRKDRRVRTGGKKQKDIKDEKSRRGSEE